MNGVRAEAGRGDGQLVETGRRAGGAGRVRRLVRQGLPADGAGALAVGAAAAVRHQGTIRKSSTERRMKPSGKRRRVMTSRKVRSERQSQGRPETSSQSMTGVEAPSTERSDFRRERTKKFWTGGPLGSKEGDSGIRLRCPTRSSRGQGRSCGKSTERTSERVQIRSESSMSLSKMRG